jgi:uncharacterized metal-binding protein YceD (DUF177 family)
MAKTASELIEELRVDTREIGESGLDVTCALPAIGLTELLADPEELPWTAVGDGEVRLRVTQEAERIRLRGGGETLLAHACVRCLREVRFPVPFELDVIFQKGKAAGPGEEEVVGTGDALWDDESAELLSQADVVPYDGQHLDIASLLREQIFLEAPMHPTCDEPSAQPPEGACTLDPDGALAAEHGRWQDPRWDALRALRENLPPGES